MPSPRCNPVANGRNGMYCAMPASSTLASALRRLRKSPPTTMFSAMCWENLANWASVSISSASQSPLFVQASSLASPQVATEQEPYPRFQIMSLEWEIGIVECYKIAVLDPRVKSVKSPWSAQGVATR